MTAGSGLSFAWPERRVLTCGPGFSVGREQNRDTGELRRDPSASGTGKALQDLAPFLGVGSAMAVTVALGVWGGHWLDGRFGTAPLFLLVGGLFGVAVAMLHFFKTVSRPK